MESWKQHQSISHLLHCIMCRTPIRWNSFKYLFWVSLSQVHPLRSKPGTSPHHPISQAGAPPSSRLERPRAIISRENVQGKCQEIPTMRSPTAWAEWIELKETLASFQAARGKEMLDNKGSDDAMMWHQKQPNANGSQMQVQSRWSLLKRLGRRQRVGFSCRFDENYTARRGKDQCRKRSSGNSATPLHNIVKPVQSRWDGQLVKTRIDFLLSKLKDKMHLTWMRNAFWIERRSSPSSGTEYNRSS